MSGYHGKFFQEAPPRREGLPFFFVFLAFVLVEGFGLCFLSLTGTFSWAQLWPMAFGGLWAVMLTGMLRLLPENVSRIGFAISYFVVLVYTGFQTGYYILFSEMMWLSDFRYASEGSDYADVLLSYPLMWWLGLAALVALGVVLVVKYPVPRKSFWRPVLAGLLAVAAAVGAWFLPEAVFLSDSGIQYAGSDYGRSKSSRAAYENMFNTHRLYQVCGLYQTLCKDIYVHGVYPMTPGYARAQEEGRREIDGYFESRGQDQPNSMTGLLEGKNVVLVLMESMDDWMINGHTPTLQRLMAEGIQFTNFYTPVFGGIRTFNTEFCINTGSFLSSQGGYAFDYVTNSYGQSLASLLRQEGYSAKTFHYNEPGFYSRGEFSPAMGYEEYVSYETYVTETDPDVRRKILYDDQLLFDNPALSGEFFREGQPTLNFLITRSAHLSYKYNEVLSHWGLKKYPQYRGLTGNEETDCAYMKARLVDDLFARLLTELETRGRLDNTVIIGVTDHYTYGYKNMEALHALSGVEDAILLEKTPCFIWSKDLEAMTVEKVLNTSDLLPTVLNLMGVESPYRYLGRDAFAESYDGFVPFSDGGWIYGDIAYDASAKNLLSISGSQQTVSAETQEEMARRVQEFVRINNLILETDYYKE